VTIYIGSKHWGEHKGMVIYCGRPSILQNPYVIGVDGTRDEVCNKFEVDFYNQITEDGPFRQEVIRLYRLAQETDVTLLCYCVPARCHCLTIKRFLDKYLEEK